MFHIWCFLYLGTCNWPCSQEKVSVKSVILVVSIQAFFKSCMDFLKRGIILQIQSTET